MESNQTCFRRGIRDGMPIAIGYFAVAFTLGIAAKNAGFTALQAMIESLTNNARRRIRGILPGGRRGKLPGSRYYDPGG